MCQDLDRLGGKRNPYIKSEDKKQLMMEKIHKVGNREDSGGISWTLFLLKDHGPIIIATFYQHLIHPFSLINDILVLPALFFLIHMLVLPSYHIITEWWWYFLNHCRLKLPLLMYLIFLIWYKENSLQAASIH